MMHGATYFSASYNNATGVAEAATEPVEGPYAEGLTPDALLVYLSTRLGSLEDQINDYFSQQQRADKLRSLLKDVKDAVNGLNEYADNMTANQDFPDEALDDMNEAIDAIERIDPQLAERLRTDLEKDGFVWSAGSSTYQAATIEPTLEYLDNAIGDLNSTSQLNMIHLQSLVRAHETAVSLGTNLIETAGRTTQKIADRIGG